jgi:hypothetical protein
MKMIHWMIGAAAIGLAGSPASSRAEAGYTDLNQSGGHGAACDNGQKDFHAVIASWPDLTKKAALQLAEKYGPPDGVMDDVLVWTRKKPWTSAKPWMGVAVYRYPALDPDPLAHSDFLENKINYAVPENMMGALARFDHALFIDQMRKVVAVHSDSEEHNTLALNLIDEIVTGARDVESARRFWKRTIEESLAGRSSPYTEGLMFTPSEETRVYKGRARRPVPTPGP